MKTKKQYYKEIWTLNNKVHKLNAKRDKLISDCQKAHDMTYQQIELDYAIHCK